LEQPVPNASPVEPSVNELEQIRFALDQSAIVAITDVPGRIKYVNDKFCEISKYSREELLGQDHRILNSGHHSKDFIRSLWRTIAQGHLWRGELRNRAKDGTYYWVDTTIVPFLNEQGKPWQYMAIRYDITERKRHEQKLQEQATLASLGEMAAVVAHEVRNPLAGIRGGIQLLSSMLPVPGEGQDFIREIVERIDALNAVIEDLLAFARLRQPRMAPVDLSSLLSDVVKGLSYDPNLTGVRWNLKIASDVVANADVNQLRSLFTNVLMNAAQATSVGKTVDVSATTELNQWRVEIRDFGPGIPAEVRERVFEPFYTTKSRGTGLGLPIARRIAEAHGGSLALGDAPGGGTAVTITLPLSGS
jgi:PAS domain S-box-containing protein